MLFSVIYSADYPVPTGQFYDELQIDDLAPPKRRSKWDLTEAHDEDAYWRDDLKMRHRKWAAILNQEDFEEFIIKLGLAAQDTETMGSIGAPGFGFGWAPAISFDDNGGFGPQGGMANAYVTPIPEVNGEPDVDALARRQELVFETVKRRYGVRSDFWRRAYA